MVVILSIIQSLLLAGVQVLLKVSVGRMLPFAWTADFFRSVFVNVPFIGCGICFGSSCILWLYILKHYPLSDVYPLMSLSYVFGMFASMIFFGEPVGLTKWVGVILIMFGCYFIIKQ